MAIAVIPRALYRRATAQAQPESIPLPANGIAVKEVELTLGLGSHLSTTPAWLIDGFY